MDTTSAIRALFRRGFTLIETLVCVVIVAILSLISLNAYNGALDQGELKFVTPNLTKALEEIRRQRPEAGNVVTVRFILNTPKYVVRGLGPDPAAEEERTLGGGILKRNIRFLRFESLEGGASEPTVTFFPNSNHLGGVIYLGTTKAEHNIKIHPSAIVPSFVP